MNCNLCPRNCQANRNLSFGFCAKTNTAEVSKVMLHSGEEPYLSSNCKSGAIFFAGCNLKCEYCQNFQISRGSGKQVSERVLASLFKQLENAGADNIDLVTPTHYTNAIINAIKIYKPKIPIIYNCGGYESPKIIKKLCKYIDIFLFDLKYCDNNLAIKYSSAPNYFDYATKSIIMAQKHKRNIFHGQTMVQGVAVRHLCLPSHTIDSLKIIDWLAKHTKKSTPISIMGQYVPYGNAKNYPEINRTLKPLEYKSVINKAKNLKNKIVLIQELSSATTQMIPDFDCKKTQFDY